VVNDIDIQQHEVVGTFVVDSC